MTTGWFVFHGHQTALFCDPQWQKEEFKYFGHSYEQKFYFSLAWDLQRMAYGHLENSDLSLSGCDYSKHHMLPWSDSPACLLSSLSSAAASSSVLTGCVFPLALEYSSVSLESTSTSGGKSRISPNIKTWCQNSFCTIAASDGCQMGWWPCTPCCSQPLWREVVASWAWPASANTLPGLFEEGVLQVGRCVWAESGPKIVPVSEAPELGV